MIAKRLRKLPATAAQKNTQIYRPRVLSKEWKGAPKRKRRSKVLANEEGQEVISRSGERGIWFRERGRRSDESRGPTGNDGRPE